MKLRSRTTLHAIWTGVGAILCLGTVAAWILAHGYANDEAVFRWAQISAILDVSEFRLTSLGLLYPHLPIYLLIPFYYLPGLASVFAPYQASVLVAGTLLALWYHHLRSAGFTRTIAATLVALIAVHPVFLWATTNGTEKSLSLLVFYLMGIACMRLLKIGDLRSIIMLGGVFALYFFVDERAVFVYIALMPLIPFLAPMRMLQASVLSTFILISLPLVIAILSWVYLNWLLHGDPLYFLYSPESTFTGASQAAHESAWLRSHGGSFGGATAASLFLLICTLPAFGWVLWQLRKRQHQLIGTAILGLHPVLAAGIATSYYFVEHPLDFVFLTIAVFMSAIIFLPITRGRPMWAPVVWLLVSWLGGWIALSTLPTAEMQQWRSAFTGTTVNASHPADQRVGQWLAHHRATTLIDNRSGYRVIAARGDADGLWLSFMREFKLAERQYPPVAEQIVVLNPRHPSAARDRITARLSDLYDHGHPNYVLALDDSPWRVYRRADLPPTAPEAGP